MGLGHVSIDKRIVAHGIELFSRGFFPLLKAVLLAILLLFRRGCIPRLLLGALG